MPQKSEKDRAFPELGLKAVDAHFKAEPSRAQAQSALLGSEAAAGLRPIRLLSVEVAEDPPWNSNKGSKESGDIFYIRQVKMRV